MKTPFLLIVTFLAAATILSFKPPSWQLAVGSWQPGNSSKIPELDKGHQQIKNVPLLGDTLDVNVNTVYAPAFRVAWTLLVTDILGEHVKTVNPIPIVDKLNLSPFQPENLDEWVFEAGSVNDGVIERVKQSLLYKFGDTESSLDRWRSEKDAVICYARLKKVMAFKYPFETLDWDFYTDNEGVKVACFGITKRMSDEDHDKSNLQRQVKIHDYRHPDDFIVVLSTSDPSTEIILAKVRPEESLDKTVEKVNERINRTFPEEFSNIDEIMIPKIQIRSDRTFHELIRQHLANKGFESWFIAEARQSVDFIMDESGALANATGEIVKIKGPTSRIYAFDEPFLVICREKESPEPDMVAWIANADVMQKLGQ